MDAVMSDIGVIEVLVPGQPGAKGAPGDKGDKGDTGDVTPAALAAAADASEARDEALSIAASLRDISEATARALSPATAIQGMLELQALGVALPFPAGEGVVWSADFDAGRYTLGISRLPADLLDFVRASKGAARGDDAQAVFGKNVPRIHDGRLWLDAGGTNPMTAPADITNAAWTKTGLDYSLATSVAGEAGTGAAKRIPETNTGSAQLHQVVNIVTIPSSDRVTFCAILGADGRDYIDLDLWNGGTSAGVRLRFNATTGAIVTPYPALLGTGAYAPKGGIWSLGGGRVLIWASCVFPAAVTLIRPTIKLLSDATTQSYTGDTAKALIVEAAWVLPGVTSPASFVETTRAAEGLSVDLPTGYYKEIVVDEAATSSTVLSIAEATKHSIVPGTDHLTMSSARIYSIPALDDFARPDTVDGASIGVGPTGIAANMLTISGGYPMIPATHGRLSGGALTITPAAVASERTFYATYDAADIGAEAWKSWAIEFSFGEAHAGGQAISNASVAIGFCRDPDAPGSTDRLIYNMPVHLVFTRSGASFQYRQTGGAAPFPIIGEMRYAMAKDRALHKAELHVKGDVSLLKVDSYPPMVVQHSILSQLCQFVFAEITSNSDNTTDTAYIARVFGAPYPLAEVTAYVAAAPVITRAAFVTPSSPASYTAGALLSVLADPIHYISNTGAVTFSYQWRKNGVNIGGATSGTYQTTGGVDVGGVFDCVVSVINPAGATNSISGATTALA
ncbi:phage head spike fiber domain-containing protein [Xanthobacter wiegelii]|uniref:phage head spike fiber domain-containing protein n=1 Tax=Xanthobacter wiegelii TaxID=3119913 RepID=UPI00372C4BD7